MKNNPSRDQLSKSLDRRIKYLMIRTLEKFEDVFPDLDNTREGGIFKGDIRNSFNDVMRAQRDELRDYDIEYRPLHMTDDNTLAITQTFMSTIQKVGFGTIGDKPYIIFYASEESRKVLDALRNEIGAGVITESEEDGLTLEIIGLFDCINSVLPIMDRYRLHANVDSSYNEWRDEVVRIYRS
jgi:hypothetical protein